MKLSCCAGLASFVPPTGDAKQLDTSAIYRSKLEKAESVLKTLADAGVDFFEFGVGMLCPESPRALFEEFQALVIEYPLKAECFNSFIPADLKVVGSNIDKPRLQNYLAEATERAKALGGEIIVFGSGGARSRGDDVSPNRARAQIFEFLSLAADAAKPHGIVIAIEHLNRSETNAINTVKEAVAYATEVNRPEIKALIDFYHMMQENEHLDEIVKAGAHIVHVHVADTGRLYPGSGNYDYAGFADALAQAGYKGRVSVECNFRDFDTEVSKSLNFLRQVFESVSEK